SPHGAVEGGLLSAHRLEHALDEGDADAAAADQRAPQQVQERSAARATRDDGALSQARRQSRGRLPADAAADPHLLRALPRRREFRRATERPAPLLRLPARDRARVARQGTVVGGGAAERYAG